MVEGGDALAVEAGEGMGARFAEEGIEIEDGEGAPRGSGLGGWLHRFQG
jgi:hypothetical protein